MAERSGRTRGKLKRALKTIAPQIAHALGGPFAGAAVTQISRAILGRTDVSESELVEAVASASPEQLVALKKAEFDFAIAARRLAVDAQRIHASDRANARARQSAMGDWAPSAIGVLIIIGFFGVLAAMVARRLPQGAETEFSIMLGALATMTASVVNYFFGSSSGSREKTRLMATPTDMSAGGDDPSFEKRPGADA